MITYTRILILLFTATTLHGAIADDVLEQRVAGLEARIKLLEQHLGTESAKLAPPKQTQIVINVAANGTFSIRPETFSLAELSTRLKDLTRLEPKPAIIIRANKETDYKHVADLLDACKAADLTNLAFANEAVGMLKKE